MNRKITRQTLKSFASGLCLLTTLVTFGCGKPESKAETPKIAHHTILGKVHTSVYRAIRPMAAEAIWSHRVEVGRCFFARRQTLRDVAPLDSHHIIECGAKVEIVNEELLVNQKSYGKLDAGVPVLVVNGRVFINDKEAQPVTQVAQK